MEGGIIDADVVGKPTGGERGEIGGDYGLGCEKSQSFLFSVAARAVLGVTALSASPIEHCPSARRKPLVTRS